MNILFVGRRQKLWALRDALRAPNEYRITHRADGTQAIAELRQHGRRYDWLIMDDQAIEGSGSNIVSVCAMGPQPASGERGPPPSPDHGRPPLVHGPCGVEWTKAGVLQMRCGLHQGPALAPERDARALAMGGAMVFEYHAPPSK